ncbi:MAG: PAS domain S-box protein, partial [Rhodocyclaceae bacterium]|nr:PAS domain S-box protein [Rhodocyclaceae bacterium]
MQDEDIRRLDLFQAVFDEFPDDIVVKDAEGRFLLCNRTVAGLYGTTPEAMVGKDDGDFGVPRKMAEEFRRNVKGIMAKGAVEVVFEDSRDATTGEIRHFKSVKKPFKDPGGRDQILVIAHDITDVVRAQERVAESERRLREVMAATQEGIWDWHVATGKVIHNSQWYSLLGFEEGEIEGSVTAFSERIHPEDKPSVWAAIQALLEGRVDHYTSEHRLIRKDGSVIWVRDRGRVAERDGQGSPVRVVGAYADVTDKRNDQVALEQALVAAESATQAKSEFLATMSHEIRTPMNGILGMAQLLMSDAVTDAERRQFAQVIIGSGQTLLTLLNDILDFSKVEAGRLDIVCEPFDPQRLVRETVAIFAEQAQSKGLALEVDCRGLRSRLYKGDAIRLR